MSSRKPVFLIVVLVVAALAASVLWWRSGEKTGRTEATPGAKEAPHVVLGASKAAMSIWVAESRHYFDQAGVTVDIRAFDAGKQAMTAVIDGTVDVATVSDFAFVKKSFTEPDLVIMAAIAEVNINRLVARGKSGIESILDLKGKRLGLTKGTTGEFFFGDQLLLNNMSKDGVEIVSLPPAKLGDALIAGDVDAVLTFEPHVYGIRKRLSADAMVLRVQDERPFYFLLVARKRWLNANQQAARGLIAGLIATEDFFAREPAVASEIINTRSGSDPEYTQYVWGDQVFRVSLSQSLILLLEDQATWLLRNVFTDEEDFPNFLERVDLRPLEAVKPQAVTIYH